MKRLPDISSARFYGRVALCGLDQIEMSSENIATAPIHGTNEVAHHTPRILGRYDMRATSARGPSKGKRARTRASHAIGSPALQHIKDLSQDER